MTSYYILAAAAYVVPCAGAALGWAMIRRADRRASAAARTYKREGDLSSQ